MFPLAERSISGYTFGQRTWYTSHHLGVDYKAKSGTSLLAPFDGVITEVLTGFQGGKTIWFKPDNLNYVIRFMHLSEWKVTKGQRVTEGQEIAKTGNTGWITRGAHLHLDISVDKVDLDKAFPSNFVDPEGLNWDWKYVPTTPQPEPVSEPTPAIPESSPDFTITVSSKVGSAYFRSEPKRKAKVMAEYTNGTKINCNDVVKGDSIVGSDVWYKTKRSGYFIHSSVAKRN